MKSDSYSKEINGYWITDGQFYNLKPENVFCRQFEKREHFLKGNENAHILFRKMFQVDAVGKTHIKISADDYYKLYINGEFVCEGPAAGYYWNYYYDEEDITKYIKEGENCIAVHTYYQGLRNRVWVSGDNMHGLIFEVEKNGKTIARSDESVLTHRHTAFTSHIIYGYSTQFSEDYDSRADEVNFYETKFDDSHWENAKIRRNCPYVLKKANIEKLVYEEIPVTYKEKNHSVIDVGREIVGNLKIEARGKNGQKVTIRYGEELNNDGSVKWKMRCNCDYEEFWILSGKDRDILMNYDYKAFRYAEILCSENVEIIKTVAVAKHYPFYTDIKCKYNDKELIDITNLCTDTLKYGVQLTYMDCPSREKGQYFGDSCYVGLAHSLLSGRTELFDKMLENAYDSGKIDDGLMAGGPSAFMQEIAEFPLMVVITTYLRYYFWKDKKILYKFYEKAKSVVEVYNKRYGIGNGLIVVGDKWNVVEWPREARDGYDAEIEEGVICKDCHAVMNAYFYGAVSSVNAMAEVLGKKCPYDIESLKKAYLSEFYDSDKRLIKDRKESEHCSVGANAAALVMNLIEDQSAINSILHFIEKKGLKSSNIFISPFILMALLRYWKEESALKEIKKPELWLNMIKEGATTTFEAFGKDKKWNTSLFHLIMAYPVLFLTDCGFNFGFYKSNDAE